MLFFKTIYANDIGLLSNDQQRFRSMFFSDSINETFYSHVSVSIEMVESYFVNLLTSPSAFDWKKLSIYFYCGEFS